MTAAALDKLEAPLRGCGCAGNQGMCTSPDILSMNPRDFKVKTCRALRKVFIALFSPSAHPRPKIFDATRRVG
jgi:hypothetical protein